MRADRRLSKTSIPIARSRSPDSIFDYPCLDGTLDSPYNWRELPVEEDVISKHKDGHGQNHPPAQPPLYFINAPIDFLLIGGASIIAFFLFKQFHSGVRDQNVINWGIYLMWAVNWPHFSATNYRLYHSKANIAQYPMTALLVPVLLTGALIGSLWSPEHIAPFLVKLFLIWSPYHFSGQSVGITMIYAKRAGFMIGKLERLALSGFIFGTFIAPTAIGETGRNTNYYFGVQYPTLGLPMWVGESAKVMMYCSGALFLLLVLNWCMKNKRLPPLMLLLPAATQYVWFVAGASVAGFREFVPFFHSLQYMLIAWSMQLKEKMDEGQIQPSKWYVLMESLRWGGANALGGAGLFWALPRLAAKYFSVPLNIAEPVVISVVQIHHFFVDGVIWKLRSPKVASPLLVNIEQMIGAPQQRPPAIVPGIKPA